MTDERWEELRERTWFREEQSEVTAYVEVLIAAARERDELREELKFLSMEALGSELEERERKRSGA